jgi:hypothetical protein
MGIKSTTHLTRAEALALRESLKERLFGLSQVLTDAELGDELDALQEEVCRREGRTCFDNYLIGG